MTPRPIATQRGRVNPFFCRKRGGATPHRSLCLNPESTLSGIHWEVRQSVINLSGTLHECLHNCENTNMEHAQHGLVSCHDDAESHSVSWAHTKESAPWFSLSEAIIT